MTLFAKIFTTRTLLQIVFVLAATVMMKALSAHYDFSWAKALAQDEPKRAELQRTRQISPKCHASADGLRQPGVQQYSVTFDRWMMSGCVRRALNEKLNPRIAPALFEQDSRGLNCQERAVKRTPFKLTMIGAASLAVVSGIALAAQDKYTLQVPGGLAFSEFRGYEGWEVVATSNSDQLKLVAVILANPVMIDAYKAGVPGNGKPFPDGAKMAKIHWTPKMNQHFPDATDTGRPA